jgi:glycosyltransferase involved in cell wall biosynthesis
MKLCLIGNDYTQQFPLVGYGGIEACVENLAYGLTKYPEIELFIIVPKRQDIDPNTSIPFELLETEEIPTSLSRRSPETFALQVKKIVSQVQPDIIWSQSNWSADILQDLNIPLICTFHDSCNKQNNWIKSFANIRYRFLSMFQYNNWITEEWEKNISFQCYSGLVDEEYERMDPNPINKYFLWCAGLQWGLEAKGLHIFIALAENNPQYQFIAYGAGNPGLEKNLTNLSIPNFTFAGSLSRGSKHREIFGRASALIMPTQIPDTFPRTCLEAVSKGTPIIASNKGSLTEVVDYTQGGVVCNEFQDYNLALESIQSLDRQNIFNNSKQFSIHKEIDSLLSYSKKLLS